MIAFLAMSLRQKIFIGLFSFSLFSACKTEKTPFTPATDALDAGANFAQACLSGDFSKASFYVLDNAAGKQTLDSIENLYRNLDKEGRNQLRTASINVLELTNLNDSLSLFRYQNSYQKVPSSIYIQQVNSNWFINFSKN